MKQGRNALTSRSGRAPRVVAVDILRGASRGVAIHRAILRIIQRGFLAQTAEVRLAASAHMITLGTPDKTSLRIVETGLSVVAIVRVRPGDVGAIFVRGPVFRRVDIDEVVDAVSRTRADDGTVAGGGSKERAEDGGAHHGSRSDGTD